ncbi:MAG: ABC transporter ATP-binding protein [Alphaproteobacteria bacterium]|nr:ABC transporter ATP-binding protein [Alphaproteobacteria bacterium]
MTAPLLALDDLRLALPGAGGWAQVLRGIGFRMGRERVALVGESGSGKSMTARAIMRLLPRGARIAAKTLALDGRDLLAPPESEVARLRGKRIGLVLQDPRHALNPVLTVGAFLGEVWRTHKGGGRAEARDAALGALERVRIREPGRVIGAYPHELSGGMGQRVMIAAALMPEPDLLIADEPTSALDASIQAEILALIEDAVATRGMGLLLISHDLPLVGRYCDRVVVLHGGRVMEEIAAKDLVHARHPYTRGLLACLPRLSVRRDRLPVLDRDPAWAEGAP